MEIELQTQQERDFDWFCVDEAGAVGHFTTAGFKRLPATVARFAEDLELVTKYFAKEALAGRDYTLDTELAQEIPDIKNRGERYLRSFVAMADRGLFSFDIASYLKPQICYFLVASPVRPIRLGDLPEPVRKVVGRTVLRGRTFGSSSRVPYEDTLSM